VELPDAAPALAAPFELEQFRAGERALLTEMDSPNTYLGATEKRFGRMQYTFRLPKGTWSLELEFLDSLNGAKVDATAYLGTREYPLLSERRVHGGKLLLEWNVEGVDTLEVQVHHHLRERPVVRHWRVGRQVVPSQEAMVPPGFQASRALYFLHPGGRHIELCDTPLQRMRLSRLPEGQPTKVTLTRAESAAP
jgi:hypothetical protein